MSAATRPPSRSGLRRPARSAGAVRAASACLLGLVLTVAGCRIARVSDTGENGEEGAQLETQIAAMLAGAATAWNRGDLEGFMSDYERSPNTTYIGASGRLVGWEAIHARYAPVFEPGAERDSLRFEALATRPLGERHALATFRFVLHRDGRVTGSGPVTLVLLAVEGRWKIIHDHSSSDPPAADSLEGP